MDEDYSKEWNAIKNKEIPKKEIEGFMIAFIKKVINEIKDGERDDLDVGDAFPLSTFACSNGYSFSKDFDKFLMDLRDYKLKFGKGRVAPLGSIEEVELALEKLKRVTLDEDYPKEWNAIKNKEISKEEIEEFVIIFIKKVINEIKDGERDDLDVGDAFPLSTFACSNGYSFSKDFDKFLMNLGDYKLKFGEGYATPLNSIEEVELALKKFI